jgi:hypothetical protein
VGGVVSTREARTQRTAPPSGGTAQAHIGIHIKGIPGARIGRRDSFAAPGRRGAGSVMALVHQVCDLVKIRTCQAAGTTIQLT